MRINNFAITKHFSFKELTVTNRLDYLIANDFKAIPYIVNMYLFLSNVIEPMREGLDIPFTVTSCFRCEGLNKLIGGSENSLHKQGRAIDLIFAGLNWEQYCDLADYIADYYTFGKLIVEQASSGALWIHISDKQPNRKNNRVYYGVEGNYTLIRG